MTAVPETETIHLIRLDKLVFLFYRIVHYGKYVGNLWKKKLSEHVCIQISKYITRNST